jgi:hypothetical protein
MTTPDPPAGLCVQSGPICQRHDDRSVCDGSGRFPRSVGGQWKPAATAEGCRRPQPASGGR